MVLKLDGNPEHVTYAWRKKYISINTHQIWEWYRTKQMQLLKSRWPICVIFKTGRTILYKTPNVLTRPNYRIHSTHARLFLSYQPNIYLPRFFFIMGDLVKSAQGSSRVLNPCSSHTKSWILTKKIRSWRIRI